MPDLTIDRSKLAVDIEKWRAQHEDYGGGEAKAWWIMIRLLMAILHRLDDGRTDA